MSDEERQTMISMFQIIEQELGHRIDEFSQEVIVAQLELQLSYVNRYYRRQFITKKKNNQDILQKNGAFFSRLFQSTNNTKSGRAHSSVYFRSIE